jgi:hypothetical protein
LPFVERIREEYTEVYGGGTSEGQQASDYFAKWEWYSTIYALAKGNILKFDKVLKLNVHEVHVFLAHKMDLQKLKAKLRQKK